MRHMVIVMLNGQYNVNMEPLQWQELEMVVHATQQSSKQESEV